MSVTLRSSRLGGVALAAIVGIATLAIVGNAVQTVTMPNMSYQAYNVPPGGIGPAVAVPVVDGPVFVMAYCKVSVAPPNFGVGQVTICRHSAGFLSWVGLDCPGGAPPPMGFLPVTGSSFPVGPMPPPPPPLAPPPHIVWLNNLLTVELWAVSPNQIAVKNNGGLNAVGTVKFIW